MQNIIQLRQCLAERFPGLRMFLESALTKATPCHPTGVPQIDQLLAGGLPKGAITELVADEKAAGTGLVLYSILRNAQQQWVGLIDGCDCFDPTSLDLDFSRLLWVRCHEAAEALKAADLLLRDGNLPLILLDLVLNPLPQLRKTPATVWYRLQRLVEHKSTALLALTPRPMISSAQARLHLAGHFELKDLNRSPRELLSQLTFALANSEREPSRLAAPSTFDGPQNFHDSIPLQTAANRDGSRSELELEWAETG